METIADLNVYIKTTDITFNRYALQLYFGNVKQPVFSSPGAMLGIFKHITDKIRECEWKIFSFIDQYQAFIADQKLTPQQDSLICTYMISYLKAMVNKRDYYYYEYADNYLGYFQKLAEHTELLKQEALIAGAGITGMLDDILQKQVLKLSHDLNEVSSAQKLKAITSLVKVLPGFGKVRKETLAPVKQSALLCAPGATITADLDDVKIEN